MQIKATFKSPCPGRMSNRKVTGQSPKILSLKEMEFVSNLKPKAGMI